MPAPLLDPATYAIIPFDPAGQWDLELPEATGAQPASLTTSDLSQLEAALTAGVARLNERYERAYAPYWQANPDSSFNRDFALIDLPRYVRQYIAFRTPAGQLLVWIRLQKYPRASWRTELRWVLDGGNDFLNGLYEPALDKLHRLQPNGSA